MLNNQHKKIKQKAYSKFILILNTLMLNILLKVSNFQNKLINTTPNVSFIKSYSKT